MNDINQQNPANIRVLGGVLIFIGLFLMCVMGAIILWMKNVIENSGRSLSTTTWNGTPEQAQIGFLVMGMVALFGLSAAAAGTFQVLTGSRSKSLIFVMLGLWIVLMMSIWAIQMFF